MDVSLCWLTQLMASHEHGTKKKSKSLTGFESIYGLPDTRQALYRRTHGEWGQILKVHIWHASCILLGSAMLRSYCLVKEWKIVKFTIFHFFHQSLYGFLVNNHVFFSDWMTPKHWLPKVIISGNISSISYHYHHTDPADNFFLYSDLGR